MRLNTKTMVLSHTVGSFFDYLPLSAFSRRQCPMKPFSQNPCVCLLLACVQTYWQVGCETCSLLSTAWINQSAQWSASAIWVSLHAWRVVSSTTAA